MSFIGLSVVAAMPHISVKPSVTLGLGFQNVWMFHHSREINRVYNIMIYFLERKNEIYRNRLGGLL